MKLAYLLCVAAALLPMLAAGQSASTQPAGQRTVNAETRENVENAKRDGSRAENVKQQREDAESPGKSENSKGKKGEPPGQAKKSKDKDKGKDK